MDSYTQTVLLSAAKVSAVTFNTWRKRNGLFPRTSVDRKWNWYSMSEICVARAVVVMTRAGVGAQIAADAAMKLLPMFERYCGEVDEPLGDRHIAVLVERPGSSERSWETVGRDELAAAFARSVNLSPVGIVVDMFRIVVEVQAALATIVDPTVSEARLLGGHEAVARGGEA